MACVSHVSGLSRSRFTEFDWTATRLEARIYPCLPAYGKLGEDVEGSKLYCVGGRGACGVEQELEENT